MPGEGKAHAMNPAIARRKAAEQSKPKAKAKGKGKGRQFRSIHIESAKNGHTVRTSYKKKGAKNDWETEDENHVFEDVDGVKKHIGRVLGRQPVDVDDKSSSAQGDGFGDE